MSGGSNYAFEETSVCKTGDISGGVVSENQEVFNKVAAGEKCMSNLPEDPVILLSVINTKLRDEYPSLEDLCEEMQIDRGGLESKLGAIDYAYDSETNQFI